MKFNKQGILIIPKKHCHEFLYRHFIFKLLQSWGWWVSKLYWMLHLSVWIWNPGFMSMIKQFITSILVSHKNSHPAARCFCLLVSINISSTYGTQIFIAQFFHSKHHKQLCYCEATVFMNLFPTFQSNHSLSVIVGCYVPHCECLFTLLKINGSLF